MILRIKALTVEENGKLVVARTFDGDLAVITGDTCALTQAVLAAVLGYTAPAYSAAVRFSAEVQGDILFHVSGNNTNGHAAFYLQAHDTDGKDCTAAYREALQQSAEEASANCFLSDERQRYPQRLFRYKHIDRFFSRDTFAARTDGLGVTRCFRAFLRRYIRDFRPRPLPNGKLWVQLRPDGRFTLNTEHGEAAPAPTKETRVLYRYLCFLILADFWQQAEQQRNFHRSVKPLLVCGAPQQAAALAAATPPDRQVFLLLAG
ncbi:MAG: hypothetical protein IKB04_04975 [Clostridia bacterium]|nr:hypothetical protein [Clostridia bacterium]